MLDVARTTDLGGIEVDDLACAVSEAVTNGICHGRPPIRVRLWAAPNRVVAAVTDQGDGPTNPFVGLLPTTGTSSTGLGLWLAHQMSLHDAQQDQRWLHHPFHRRVLDLTS